jgi:hypothetical protein
MKDDGKNMKSCCNRLRKRFDNLIGNVSRDHDYPEPLYEYAAGADTPVLITNHPVVVADRTVNAIYALGMPQEKGKEACFNYLEELLEAAGVAREKLEADITLDLHLVMPTSHEKMQHFFKEWCAAKGHGQLQKMHGKPREKKCTSFNKVLMNRAPGSEEAEGNSGLADPAEAEEGDFVLPLADANSPPGVSRLCLHVRSDKRVCDEFLFNNLLHEAERQNRKHPLENNRLLLVYDLKVSSSCIIRLNKKYNNEMDFVARGAQYPEPLYVHPDVSNDPVLIASRPIAVSDSSIKGIYAYGLPDYRGKEACFNYLEELLEAAGEAQEKLEEGSVVEVHLVLSKCWDEMQKIVTEWCAAKGHGLPPGCKSLSVASTVRKNTPDPYAFYLAANATMRRLAHPRKYIPFNEEKDIHRNRFAKSSLKSCIILILSDKLLYIY